jgi:regulator of ribonuclease activity B
MTLAQMEDMFQNIRAKTKWNVDGDLLWGYFFMDPQPEKLRPLGEELAAAGYRVVNLYPSPNGRTHVLHVEKVETHTPQSLHQRNLEFYRLADKFGVSSYDGMDVGPAGPQPQR